MDLKGGIADSCGHAGRKPAGDEGKVEQARQKRPIIKIDSKLPCAIVLTQTATRAVKQALF
ncbi:hypothetical protein Tdes44962_MAKER02092 [Teratosphaeria destructans]|uniref:Uncharacterized protein n=1 Tax=Teratosphaeria destructans TaxID=418781 RepID=A0A9W7SV75_9PEZI|nr:hypothetical protein Tdes44962_MAKER02092 [Teratosphaeria destructans]